MKPRPTLLMICAASAVLACSAKHTSESTGDVYPATRSDSAKAPTDTTTVRARDDTLSMHRDTTMRRDTSMYRDTTMHRDTSMHRDTTMYRDTTMHRDTTMQRDTTGLPRDTSTMRRDTSSRSGAH